MLSIRNGFHRIKGNRNCITASDRRKYKTICRCGTEQEVESMKGFTTSAGYMGWVKDRYILFATEYDYREYMEE